MNANGKDAHEIREHQTRPLFKSVKSGKTGKGNRGGGKLGEFTHHKDEQLEFKPEEETIVKSND